MFKQIKGHTFLHWEIKAKQILDMFLHNKRNKFNKLGQDILGWRGFRFVQMKSYALLQTGEKVKIYLKL